MNTVTSYNAIVLSSGAARGIYQLGALNYLHSLHLLKDIKYFAGTSVGAAIALCIAIGYTPLEVCSYLCANDVNQCFKFKLNFYTLLETWGFIDRNILKEYLTSLVIKKVGKIPTFKNLSDTGKIFICTSYCITSEHPKVYFSPKTHPNMSVVEAVMLSANIPLIFTKADFEDDIYIDGGMFDRLPAEFVYSYIADEWETPEVLIIDLSKGTSIKRCNSIQDYIKYILYAPLDTQRHHKFVKKGMHYFLIHCNHDGPLTLTMSTDEKIKSFCKGSEEMAKLLNQRAEDKLKLD